MTVTADQIRTLARACVSVDAARQRERALAELGGPDDAAVVDGCLQSLDSEDRNQRVAALRVLRWHTGELAASGILRGLRDPKRRVREAAVKCSEKALSAAAVVARLHEIVRDESEKRRIRGSALYALAGPAGRPLRDAVSDAIGDLARADAYRSRVLFLLLRAPLTDASRALLEEIVRIGTKEEAVTATRALCGFRVAHIGEFEGEERRRVERTCPIAAGRVWYWVER